MEVEASGRVLRPSTFATDLERELLGPPSPTLFSGGEGDERTLSFFPALIFHDFINTRE